MTLCESYAAVSCDSRQSELSLVAELMYRVEPSCCDAARHSFAHGGKDGILYPVSRTTYEQTLHAPHSGFRRAHMGENDRLRTV